MDAKKVAVEGRDEFAKMCEEVLPHIEAIREIMRQNGNSDSASISIGEKGYINFRQYGNGWEMYKLSNDDNPRIKYEYSEEIGKSH